MTDGEWWRKSGPWSERSGGGPAEAASGGAADVPPAAAPDPGPDFDPDSVYDPPAPSVAGFPSVSLDLPDTAVTEERADAIPPPTVSSTGPWTMTMFDFSDGPRPAPKPIPEQRAAEGDEAAAGPGTAAEPAEPAELKKKPRRGLFGRTAPEPAPPAGKTKGKDKAKGRKGRKEQEQAAPARRPSPLVLLSCGLLAGGAVSGVFPVMLAGWGLGYLSRQISELMRKFVVLGIPLITISGSTFYSMRQARQGGGGQVGGLQSGSPLGEISWTSAPGVLRLAAGLSAVVLLLLALRRRPPQQGEQG
ncbi:hypothetical protein ACIQOW_25715 [Kitasatospora sp. NPDC091335]|uniref:hypothetical protein n=1 Tax=Kitasatospora sp. NPDC091335 TaxID=3364085 RepID=UPI003813FDD2